MGQSKAYITLIIIGIILLMVSGGILALLYVMNSGADIVMMLGIIINEVGVGLLALGLIMGAMKDDSLHHITRLAMIIGMAVVVAYLHLKVVNWSPYW